jgi:hypothetical protein
MGASSARAASNPPPWSTKCLRVRVDALAGQRHPRSRDAASAVPILRRAEPDAVSPQPNAARRGRGVRHERDADRGQVRARARLRLRGICPAPRRDRREMAEVKPACGPRSDPKSWGLPHHSAADVERPEELGVELSGWEVDAMIRDAASVRGGARGTKDCVGDAHASVQDRQARAERQAQR